jgi:hypothetical protein
MLGRSAHRLPEPGEELVAAAERDRRPRPVDAQRRAA